MIKHAVILSGGKGTRLRPYTVVLPKPLMPIGDFPILEVVIRQLVHSGFTNITLAVNHQSDLIKAFFGDGSKWNVKIDYSLEIEPLGTIGPLKLIKELPENFLLMNGDVLTDLNFEDFFNEHVLKKSIFSICSHVRTHRIDYGVLEVDENDVLEGFREKPTKNYLVSMGVYVVNKKIIKYIPETGLYGFDHLMHDLLKDNKEVNVKPYKGYWLDIGRPDDYMQAIDEFAENREKFLKE